MRQPDWQGHEVVDVAAGVAEHHALITRAEGVQFVLTTRSGAMFERHVDAAGDVGTLLVERDEHGAVLSVKALGPVVVANVENRAPRASGDVDDGRRGDLSHYDAQPRGEERLAGDAREGILGENGVEDPIGHLIGNLVRVPFGHRLRRKEGPVAHWAP